MKIFGAILVAVLVFLAVPEAHADSETLLPLTLASLNSDLRKALSKTSVHDPLTPVGCLDGGAEKRTVCSFKLGNYMSIAAETQKAGKDIVGITMICGTEKREELAKCLLAYSALMVVTSAELTADVRGKILKVLLYGLNVGSLTTVRTDERKYTLQKSVGLWFHVYATDAED